MDFKTMETASGADYGQSLTGIGINLLVKDVLNTAEFLRDVFEMVIIRADKDFAIIGYGKEHFMLHHDATYAENALISLLPEAGARGAGLEIRLYDTDPQTAQNQAEKLSNQYGCSVLIECADHPHGLHECFILSREGYCFIPSRSITT